MNRLLTGIFFISIIISSAVFGQNAAEKETPFHFNHYKLQPDSQISAAYLNSPITEKDRIKVSEDGHLEADGKRIRIFGTNLSEFPVSHKQADFSAKALASQGYNCIRFHHTDANWSNCFFKRTESGKWVLNTKRLDDFDYFFAQLKENGIYSNINFLTGRTFYSSDGYLPELDKISDWKSRHCLGFWDETALKHQQEWAATLMNHVNPYTGIAYKDDPAVAFVEINNENGLLMGYLTGWLEEYTGTYWQELEDQWNEWLNKNDMDYTSLSGLYNQETAFGQTLLDKKSKWNLEQHDTSKATLQTNGAVTSIKVTQNGTESWHVQYNCPGLSFYNNKIYTVKFSVKSSKPQKIGVSLMEAHSPWKNSGWDANVNTTAEWTDYSFTVQNIETDDNLRLNFGGMGLCSGTTFYFKDISITEGGSIECVKQGKKSDRDQKTVLLPHFSEYKTLPEAYKNTILKFLYETEEKYWITMKSFVTETLQAKPLVMGTIVGCSTPALQSCFDVIDTHSYWNHPVFPVKDWDMSNYYVNNRTLLKADGNNTLFSLAKNRVYGKPFSVTEYDHPYPNQYSSEMYPMYASFASYQDWDCIYTFCSSLPKTSDGQKQKIGSYFDQSNNPAKSCAAPFAAKIFRQFMVKPTETKAYINLSRETEMDNLCTFYGWSIGGADKFGSIPELSSFCQLGINLKGITPDSFALTEGTELSKVNFTLMEKGSKKVKGFDETQQLYWDQNSGVYIVCNNKVTVAVLDSSAVLPDYPDSWKDNLKPAFSSASSVNNGEFASFIAIRDLKNSDNADASTLPYLIFSSSWSGNKGEALKEYGKNTTARNGQLREQVKITTAGTLGQGPALALGSSCSFTLPGRHTLYKIDLTGNKTISLSAAGGDTASDNTFKLSAADGTLWYVLE